VRTVATNSVCTLQASVTVCPELYSSTKSEHFSINYTNRSDLKKKTLRHMLNKLLDL